MEDEVPLMVVWYFVIAILREDWRIWNHRVRHETLYVKRLLFKHTFRSVGKMLMLQLVTLLYIYNQLRLVLPVTACPRTFMIVCPLVHLTVHLLWLQRFIITNSIETVHGLMTKVFQLRHGTALGFNPMTLPICHLHSFIHFLVAFLLVYDALGKFI